jgi:hypothetical protein
VRCELLYFLFYFNSVTLIYHFELDCVYQEKEREAEEQKEKDEVRASITIFGSVDIELI